MATGVAGKITVYSDPPVVAPGAVVPDSYIANVTANINRLIDGNGVTLKSLQIDGTGNNAVTSPAGVVQVSATANSSSLPTGATVAGALYKDLIPLGWAYVTNSGGTYTLTRGVNIASITKVGTGVITITLSTQPANNVLGNITLLTPSGNFLPFWGSPSSTGGQVIIVNTSNTAQDASFFATLWGY